MIIHESKASFGRDVLRAYVTPGEKIELHTYRGGELVAIRVFQVGDAAEYDSYNLTYWGRIKAITAKSVVIIPRYESNKTRRLNLDTFSWRNWDFNLEEVNRRNSEWSD